MRKLCRELLPPLYPSRHNRLSADLCFSVVMISDESDYNIKCVLHFDQIPINLIKDYQVIFELFC